MNVSDRLPASLIDHAGMIVRSRCLSERRGRAVYLCLDAAGRMRIFKVHTGLNAPQVESYLGLLVRLSGLAPGSSLMPILGFGHETDCVWEELPLADHVEDMSFDFDNYSPAQPARQNHFDKHQSLCLAVDVGAAVCSALVELGRAGLVHGDVKPSNVMKIGGQWFLGDFDTVSSASRSDEPTPSTEGYAPPEADGWAGRDSYALGKLLYELWTGCDRLEFPTVPPWLMQSRWDPKDRLINDAICSLCSPLASRRLQNLDAVKKLLDTLKDPAPVPMGQARKLLRNRRTYWNRVFAALGLLTMVLIAGHMVFSSRPDLWDDEPVVFCTYRNPKAVSDGYVRWADDGVGRQRVLFNTHATLRNPLREGDEVEVALLKDTWRGHMGLYLSDKPFYSFKKHAFSDREHFGGINHLLFFHVEGDWLNAPTAFNNGTNVLFSRGDWKVAVSTNTLATYRVRLSILPTEYRWSVSAGAWHLADGQYPRKGDVPVYLNVYTYDNTLCYLRQLSVKRNR